MEKKKKKKERTKAEKKEEEGGKRGNFFEISRKGWPVKRKEKKTHFNVWFGLG